MPRRGNNIYKRKDGRWEGRLKKEGERGQTGRRYISIYGKTYSEVKVKMEQAKNDKRKTDRKEPCLEKVIDIWLEEKKSEWKQSTYATYLQMAKKYIIPYLGSVRTDGIDEQIIGQFLSKIRMDQNGKTLSNRYLRSICAVILKAMKYVKRKYHYEIAIPENLIIPARQRQIIPPREQNMFILEKYLLEHLENDTCLGILIVFYMGLRIGEVCALTWGDVNLEEEVIYVQKNLQRVKIDSGGENSTQILIQTPKTTASSRIIPIPPVLLPGLRKYKREDGQYVIKGKKKPWSEPRTLQYRFAQILKECDLEAFNFHMLRHAFASRCVERGFDVKSLSEILGHSSTQITLNLYVHSNMQHKRELMNHFL